MYYYLVDVIYYASHYHTRYRYCVVSAIFGSDLQPRRSKIDIGPELSMFVSLI